MKKNKYLIAPIERYNPSVSEGLSLEQVNNRIKEKNVNFCEKKYSKSVLNIFFENIFSFFNLLGLIVTVALIISKAKFSSFFFDIIFISNTIIGIVQELRAKITIDKLSLISLSTIKVVRNSETISIPSKEIVLDDILYLGIGNQIPTDSIVLDGIIEVNESLLTGESIAVKKQKGDEIFENADSVVIEIDMEKDIVKKTVQLAQKHNKKLYGVVSNMNIAVERRDFLQKFDCLICNKLEAGIFFSDDFEELTADELLPILKNKVEIGKIPSMIVTLGGDGAIFAECGGTSGFCPAKKVIVKDTSGAGDAFCAGVVSGLTYGKNMEEATAKAKAVERDFAEFLKA